MPHPCVVCGRSRMNPNNREEEYMFFGFPVNDESRCRKWLEFCCREDLYKLTKKQLLQRMVCSKHFEQRDFLNSFFDRLNCTAVPSIYDPKQSLYNITCVLCGRSRLDPPNLDYDGTTFHHFPGEEFRCLKWLDFVGVDSYYRLTRKEILFCYICSKHFDKSQFIRGYRNRLVDNSVPNIKFPDQIEDSEPYIMELLPEPKLFHSPERVKKLEPLPPAVLDSQACAACGRSRSDPKNKVDRYKFHPFPAYEIGRCLRWCQFLGREDLLKMSPNQIRKLVLCSKHFQSGQSFHRVGPCDAVPTIRDIPESNQCSENLQEKMTEDMETIDEEGKSRAVVKGSSRAKQARPMVSSKKPKVENKPAPLAKKRGKSKRPTLINIPRPDPNNIENRVIRKLPLPPTNNWKLIQTGTMQPITLANNLTAATGGGVNDGKKMILPFTGDITNLGTPIPVHSLSSIPPGLLIKINLPDQGQNKKRNQVENKNQNLSTVTTLNNVQFVQCTPIDVKNGCIATTKKESREGTEQSLSELLSFAASDREEAVDYEELAVEEEEEEVLPDPIEIENEQQDAEEENNIKEEFYYRELEPEEVVHKRKIRQRKRLSALARKTILPMKSEIRFFLRKLAPRMQRLPKKARAQLKLSMVNMVIDNL